MASVRSWPTRPPSRRPRPGRRGRQGLVFFSGIGVESSMYLPTASLPALASSTPWSRRPGPCRPACRRPRLFSCPSAWLWVVVVPLSSLGLKAAALRPPSSRDPTEMMATARATPAAAAGAGDGQRVHVFPGCRHLHVPVASTLGAVADVGRGRVERHRGIGRDRLDPRGTVAALAPVAATVMTRSVARTSTVSPAKPWFTFAWSPMPASVFDTTTLRAMVPATPVEPPPAPATEMLFTFSTESADQGGAAGVGFRVIADARLGGAGIDARRQGAAFPHRVACRRPRPRQQPGGGEIGGVQSQRSPADTLIFAASAAEVPSSTWPPSSATPTPPPPRRPPPLPPPAKPGGGR